MNQSQHKKKIGIMGIPVSSRNRGVMALGTALINLCQKRKDGTDILLMTGHRQATYATFRVGDKSLPFKVVNNRLSLQAGISEHLGWIVIASILYRLCPFRAIRQALIKFTPWVAALVETDLVGDIRGGDSFSDIYGLQRFLVGFFEKLSVIMVKGNMVQFPQTIGPFRRTVSRVLARYVLKHSSVIIARDSISQKVAQSLIKNRNRVWLCPDVAFTLDAVEPKILEVLPECEGQPPRGTIGLNINGLMYNGGYTDADMFGLSLDYRIFLLALIKVLLSVHDGELWLVPHTYGLPGSPESDPEACKEIRGMIAESARERVRTVTGEYDCNEIKGVIGMFDFFIGSRMHACIAALSQGIPCVGVAYSRKFEGVFDSVGMGDWVIDGRAMSNEEAVEKTLALYQRRDAVRPLLMKNAEKAKIRVREVFSKLLSTDG